MITKRHLVIAVLCISCLTVVLFTMVPVGSQGPPYDAWWDLTDDGKIDIADLARVSGAYGTLGDPTKNVNVTNWPTNPPYLIQSVTLYCTFTIPVNVSDHYYYYNYSTTPIIYVGGYSRMWIYLAPPSPNETSQYAIANYGVDQYVVSIDWIDDPSSYHSAHEFPIIQSITEVNVSTLRSPPMYAYSTSMRDNPIETKSPYLRLTIYSYTAILDDPGWMNMTVKIYLRNE